ncbi:MAG: DUF6496 domain-containing protein [Bryobacteraceae bacterium]
MAAKKSASTKKTSAKGQAKVGKVMHEYKHGQLKSGGKAKVKNRKQAVAIALSEARKSGAKVAPPKKKSSTKSASSQKSPAKKSSSKSHAKKS